VRLRDRFDDREAEAEGTPPVARAAHEALEQVRRKLGRDAGALVLDHEHRVRALAARLRADRRARRGVAQRVLEQVDHQAVQLVAGGVHRHGVDVELDFVFEAHGPELAGRLDDDLGEVHRLARDDAPGVRAGEQQQVGDEPAHALGGAQRGARGLSLLAAQRVREQLEVREHARERRAQLV
jgi:hypothetical protein